MYVPSLGTTQYLVAPPGSTGPSYDRTAPRNLADYPKCATLAVHNAAHTNCKPYVEVIRGLGLLDLAQANPCWVETLPLCPSPRPILAAVPKKKPVPVAAPRPVPITAAGAKPAPAPAPASTPAAAPVPILVPPPLLVSPPPPAPIQPAQAGFTTGGLLAIAAAVGIGGWVLFGRKKKQPQ